MSDFNRVFHHIMTKQGRRLIMMLMMAVATVCHAQTWQSVALKRQITHPQPMTGLVLWLDEARDRNTPSFIWQ